MTWEGLELVVAERYATASIIYYGGTGACTGMSDAQFDGIADSLLKNRSFTRIPWLEEEMLKAGSGYDVAVFPQYLHEMAGLQLVGECECVPCMARRGEIADPEVLERLGVS